MDPVVASSPPATALDVADRWRPLSDDERALTQALLGDAWGLVLARVPSAAGWQDGTVGHTVLKATLTAMVRRVLGNPDGKRQETIDDYSYVLDETRSSGTLHVSLEEVTVLRGVYGGGRPRVRGVRLVAHGA